MRVGLDLSLTSTGICVMDENGTILFEEVLNTPKKKIDGLERLKFIRESVSEAIKNYSVSIANIENYSFGSRGRATFSLGELGGVVRLLLFDLGVTIIETSPSQLKKFATGRGNSDKLDVVMSIEKNYGIKYLDDNAADAFILAKMID